MNIPFNQLRRALHELFPGRGDSAQRSSTVLVVDDEPLIVQGLAAILNSEGFTVLTAFELEQVRATLAGVQPGGPPQPHNTSAGNEGVLVGNRPRRSRRATPFRHRQNPPRSRFETSTHSCLRWTCA